MEGPRFAGFAWPAVFRLQGLVTLVTVYALRVPGRFYFAPAALMGFTLRSFLLRKGIPPVSEQDNPPTVPPACIPFAEASGRLAGRSSWVFNLFKVPGGSHVFSTSTAGCSLGFLPSKALHENLGWDFAQPPLTRFPSDRSRTAAPQSLDRSSLQPHPPFT
jgi:hypothetical protein